MPAHLPTLRGLGWPLGIPRLLPPLPLSAFPHKDGRVLAGMQARILALWLAY